jgi:Predicted membrane protein
MFRHRGKSRTISHNKKIASLLSFVAGVVNVTGFLSVQRLTTNVTGHFAFFVDEVFRLEFSKGFVYFFYVFCFFLGAFVSSFMMESMMKRGDRYIYVLPGLCESAILLMVALCAPTFTMQHPNFIACWLLFAMGLQNALVTRISGALVRTTHLTGLFTDLGIEMSQLFFYKKKEQKERLFSVIRLRWRIILFFFIGGIAGGILYSYMRIYALVIPALILLAGLYYDSVKLQLIKWKRRYDAKDKA